MFIWNYREAGFDIHDVQELNDKQTRAQALQDHTIETFLSSKLDFSVFWVNVIFMSLPYSNAVLSSLGQVKLKSLLRVTNLDSFELYSNDVQYNTNWPRAIAFTTYAWFSGTSKVFGSRKQEMIIDLLKYLYLLLIIR